jgi:hypothetical protein
MPAPLRAHLNRLFPHQRPHGLPGLTEPNRQKTAKYAKRLPSTPPSLPLHQPPPLGGHPLRGRALPPPSCLSAGPSAVVRHQASTKRSTTSIIIGVACSSIPATPDSGQHIPPPIRNTVRCLIPHLLTHHTTSTASSSRASSFLMLCCASPTRYGARMSLVECVSRTHGPPSRHSFIGASLNGVQST